MAKHQSQSQRIISQRVILIIEDEVAIREMITYALEKADFNVIEAGSIPEANKILRHQKPDLIILDWMLPGGSGIQYIKQLKKEARLQTIPIIMLTARAEEHNKVTGLDAGADDYITKPFSPKELIARIKSVLRRGGRIVENIFHADELKINPYTKEVFYKNQKINFSLLEYKLIYFLAAHPNKVYTREQILENVWSESDEITDRTVDTHVKRVRKKLEPFGLQKLLQTHRGSGYFFELKENDKK